MKIYPIILLDFHNQFQKLFTDVRKYMMACRQSHLNHKMLPKRVHNISQTTFSFIFYRICTAKISITFQPHTWTCIYSYKKGILNSAGKSTMCANSCGYISQFQSSFGKFVSFDHKSPEEHI